MKSLGNLAFWLVFTAALISQCRAGAPAKDDIFLDQPFPDAVVQKLAPAPPPDSAQRMMVIASFTDGIELLGEMSGKKVLLPKDLAEWPDENTEKNWGIRLGAANKKTVRELFEHVAFEMGMVWHYNAAQDAILLEPKWRREDSRSAKQLVGILTSASAVPFAKLPWGAVNSIGGRDWALDDWRLAFDALLSKPENFSSAGTLRVFADAHCPLAPEGSSLPVPVLFAGKMIAGDGPQATLILIGPQSMGVTGASPGDVTYYLFDEDGRFIKGGDYEIGQPAGWLIGAQAAGQKGITVGIIWGKYPVGSHDDFHFILTSDGLVLNGSTDSHGKERDADETRNDYPNIARSKFSVSGHP